MRLNDERGFTLPELIVVTVGFLVLLLAAAVLLAPANYATEREDTKRRVDVAVIVQRLNAYVADTGRLPDNIPDEQTVIGTATDEYDLCSVLAEYIRSVPLDPLDGVVATDVDDTETGTRAVCGTADMEYSTGYSIAKDGGDRILVSALLADEQLYGLATQTRE
jgi:type II secretory pathway pseudopilin PulG